jgi:hypothetical protein
MPAMRIPSRPEQRKRVGGEVDQRRTSCGGDLGFKPPVALIP